MSMKDLSECFVLSKLSINSFHRYRVSHKKMILEKYIWFLTRKVSSNTFVSLWFIFSNEFHQQSMVHFVFSINCVTILVLNKIENVYVLLFFYQQSKLCGDVFNVLGKSMELFSTITSRYIYNYTLIKSWILDKWVFY